MAPAWAADTGHSCQGYSLQLRLDALSGFTFGTHDILIVIHTQWASKHCEGVDLEVFDVVLTVQFWILLDQSTL